jgi:hypothetical protein
MSIDIVHTLLAEPEEGGGVDGIERIWPQSIEDTHQDELGLAGH